MPPSICSVRSTFSRRVSSWGVHGVVCAGRPRETVTCPPPPLTKVTPRVDADGTTVKPSSTAPGERSMACWAGRQPMGRRCVFPVFKRWPLARPNRSNPKRALASPARRS